MNTQDEFLRFFETIKTLRAPGGCPWDREQTPLTMRNDLIEETFEAVDAISQEDSTHAKEELGDVLLNATMIAYMYEQENKFSVQDVYKELTDKLIRRHPHVFPESQGKECLQKNLQNSQEVLKQWDNIKEKIEGRKEKSILDTVPKGFPPLLKAYKLQKKAAKKGFDWKDLKPVKDKITEEMQEVEQAYNEHISLGKTEKTQSHLEEELGDLLFAVVNYARHLGVDPSVALTKTNNKFYNRFTFVEKEMSKANIPMDNEHLEQEDYFWNKAKENNL